MVERNKRLIVIKVLLAVFGIGTVVWAMISGELVAFIPGSLHKAPDDYVVWIYMDEDPYRFLLGIGLYSLIGVFGAHSTIQDLRERLSERR